MLRLRDNLLIFNLILLAGNIPLMLCSRLLALTTRRKFFKSQIPTIDNEIEEANKQQINKLVKKTTGGVLSFTISFSSNIIQELSLVITANVYFMITKRLCLRLKRFFKIESCDGKLLTEVQMRKLTRYIYITYA